MDISKFLSKVLGLYFIIVAAAMLLNMQDFIRLTNELINDKPLMFVTGFFTLILGLLLVVSHNIWQWNWRVIITLIAWLSLLKGTTILLYPEFLTKMTQVFIENSQFAYASAGFDFILGVILCYFGFRDQSKKV